MNPATGLDAEDPYSRRLRTRFDESRGVHIVQDTHISQCPHCGLASHEDAENIPDHVRQRIAELESQVVILTGKATDAVEKLADYEEKLGQATRANASPSSTPANKGIEPLPSVPSPGEGPTLNKRPSNTGRFGSFLSRKPSPVAAPGSQTAPIANEKRLLISAREHELTAVISEERNKRQQAEEKISQMSVEVEELSTTLFQQANEMVSTERQARAKLEERAQVFETRCEVLEEKVRILEKRDADKRRRLERLEEGLKRCERVRNLLQSGAGR